LQYKAHGPFAAKLCDACHNKRDNTLLMPIESLCLNCHHLNINKKYIHGPVASGGCRVCHDPHGSGYPFLLTAEPREFCPRCHDKSLIFAKEVHEGTTEQCTTCHDAHSSDMPNLLR
jgi:predicted CXXCH cytochrome family protein